MYSTNNSGWRQELTPYNQYEEERAPNLDSVFAKFMAYHASSKANHNAIQNQEIQYAKVFLEDYQGEPESQFYYQNEAERSFNLDILLMQFKDTIGSIQRAFKSAEIQVGKLVEEVTQAMSRREEEIVEVDTQEESPVNEHDLEEEDEEKAQQREQCLQTHTQQEDNFQVNTCSHQLTIKEERHEDHEGSIILGQPCLSFASCVLDMGKGKLELNVEDQKISFDLIEAIKHPVNGEDWFEAEISEQEMELTASAMVL